MSDAYWRTQNNLLINVPDYIIENEMMSFSSEHTDGFETAENSV